MLETQAALQDTTGQRAALNRWFKHTVIWRGHVVECRRLDESDKH